MIGVKGTTLVVASGDDVTDAVAVETATVDRLQVAGSLCNAALALMQFTATLQEDQTLSLRLRLLHGEADPPTTAVELTAAAVCATGGSGGSTETDLIQHEIDLRGYGRYIRLETLPDLSQAVADPEGEPVVVGDTASVATSLVLARDRVSGA
jgi:hypothetical protein